MKHLLNLVLFSMAFSAGAQATWEFAFSNGTASDGQLYSLFVVKVYRGEVVESRPLSSENFFLQAAGRTESPANPGKEDLFEKFRISPCTLPPDSVAMGYSLHSCSVLDNLWKLRFWEYPLQTADSKYMGTGWSEEKLRPSERQMQLLGHYGMKGPTGMIRGDRFFQLLHDMTDPAWIDAYRKGS